MARIVPGVTETVGVHEAAEVLGVSENFARSLITRGEFPVPVIRIGRLIRVPTDRLMRFAQGVG
jgi:excisionase family DNA binding protein